MEKPVSENRELNRKAYERIVWLHGQIQAKTYPNSKSLHEKFGVKERTAYRDVEFLKYHLNAPLEFDRKRNGFYYTDESFTLPAVWMTEGELMVIYLAEKVLRQYAGAIYEQELKSAFAKLCACLPQSISVNLNAIASDISIDPGPAREVETETYKQLVEAIRERRSVEIIHYSAERNETTQRVVDPYHLHNQFGDWNLIAYDHLRKDMRNFALSRIRSIAKTNQRFEVHPDFNRETYLANQFWGYHSANPIEVVARFDPYQARWIREKQWPGEQCKEESEDGSLLLTFHAHHQEAAMRWLMQYGSHVQVLQPQELADAIANEVERMKTIYQRRS
ncbi:MAG: WYL domain-containing protein [Fimbriimonadia bacterium]|nr:WYL domain-containing protein [Fimbriimonadia bacterium]